MQWLCNQMNDTLLSQQQLLAEVLDDLVCFLSLFNLMGRKKQF